jgi:salicylate hydroxylase
MGEAMEVALAEARGEKKTREEGDDKNLWANKKKNDEQYGYDAEAVADAWWAENEEIAAAN